MLAAGNANFHILVWWQHCRVPGLTSAAAHQVCEDRGTNRQLRRCDLFSTEVKIRPCLSLCKLCAHHIPEQRIGRDLQTKILGVSLPGKPSTCLLTRLTTPYHWPLQPLPGLPDPDPARWPPQSPHIPGWNASSNTVQKRTSAHSKSPKGRI